MTREVRTRTAEASDPSLCMNSPSRSVACSILPRLLFPVVALGGLHAYDPHHPPSSCPELPCGVLCSFEARTSTNVGSN